MKINRIALAVALAAPAFMTANAAVNVSPLMLGYHYMGEAHDEQRAELRGNNASGVTKKSGLYTGVGVGVELTPSISVELAFGVSKADGQKSEADYKANPANRFDVRQRNASANLVVTSDLITQNYSGKFKPYITAGVGLADYEFTQQATGKEVYEQRHHTGNTGLGAYFRVNDKLTLRGEGRAIFNMQTGWVEGLALAGLQVALGDHLKPTFPAPPMPEPETVEVKTPVDSDGDGVVDGRDKCPGTPRGTMVDANGCPSLREQVVSMPVKVFFDTNKSYIKPQYQAEVSKVANFMKQYPNATAVIEGHTDSRGSARYNQRLSQRRANAVKGALITKYQINPARLRAMGYGETKPVAPNNTKAGRATNRRVLAVVTGKKKVAVKR